MKLFWRFIRTDIKKSKRNFALFGYTIFLGGYCNCNLPVINEDRKAAICRYTFIGLWQL